MKQIVSIILAAVLCLGLAGCRLEDVEELTKPVPNKNWKGSGVLTGTVYTLSEKWMTNHPEYTGWTVDGDLVGNDRVRISAVKEGKRLYGYADLYGRIVIAPAYSDAVSFDQGYAAVQRDGLWGLINTAGEAVLDCAYDGVYGVGGNRIAVITEGTCVQYMDMRGNSRLRVNNMYGGPFSDGFAYVVNLRTGDYGFIDTKGNVVIDTIYDAAGSFVDGYAMVKEGSSVSVINKSGAVTGKLPGSNIGVFIDGYTLRYLSDSSSPIPTTRVYTLYDPFGQICGEWKNLFHMTDFEKGIAFLTAPADETGATARTYGMDMDGNTYALSLSDRYNGFSYSDGVAFGMIQNEDGTVTYHLYMIG
ncbi:MAG: WG repeat-containing protein [Christensenellales bacterium]|jgi:hypothetical protein